MPDGISHDRWEFLGAALPAHDRAGVRIVRFAETQSGKQYAQDCIRWNAVAPGVVDTPLHWETPREVMEGRSPMHRPSTVKDITDAVMYLTEAATVTGDTLYVDGGAHVGSW